MEISEAEDALNAASLLSRFHFLLEEDEAERFEGEGTGKGTSPKAEEGRRRRVGGGWHIQSYGICGCITISLFLVCA